MSFKNLNDGKQKALTDSSASDAWHDEPATITPLITSFGVGSDESLKHEVSEGEIEEAMELGVQVNEYLTAKAAGAALIRNWINVASSSPQKMEVSTTDIGMNNVPDKEETPVSNIAGRPSILKFPVKEQGIEAITTLLSVLTKKTEDLDAQHAEQLRQQKASNAELENKLQRSEQLMQELQSTKKRIELERDQANSRHKSATFELEQAEKARRNLEQQLVTAKTNIESVQAAHQQAVRRTWGISIISLLIVAAVIIAKTVFKVF